MKKFLLLTLIFSMVLPLLALDAVVVPVLIAQSDIEADDDYASDADYASDDDYANDSDYASDDDYASDSDYDSDDDYASSESNEKSSTKTATSAFAADSSWLPTDTVPAIPNISPSLTAISALALGIINLILLLFLFRKMNKRS